jgi:hypothetical protein
MPSCDVLFYDARSATAEVDNKAVRMWTSTTRKASGVDRVTEVESRKGNDIVLRGLIIYSSHTWCPFALMIFVPSGNINIRSVIVHILYA